MIESFHHKILPVMAVQWHPEMMVSVPLPDTSDPMPVFRHFYQMIAAKTT
ncbi:hypothetical protein [Pseudoflavonifractor capillosus]|nr:hypothetical protein [Pseudoflavonifractor capillosus]MBM6680123.1 hypothetical protein [Pseudoflavonifractor capillosus]